MKHPLTRPVIRFVAVFVLLSLLGGCSLFRKDSGTASKGTITLNYYRFGADAETVRPLLDKYQSSHPGVIVQLYTKFPSYAAYEDAVINEMAEGGGPDVFSMPNTWIYRHQRKIAPMPTALMSVDKFRQIYVAIADRDLVRPTGANPPALGIYGIPLYVDTLGVFYNKKHYEDRLPSRGRPAALWKDFAQDISTLNKGESGDTFEVAGSALGRTDNVRYGLDVLYGLFLQYGVHLFNDTYSASALTQGSSLSSGGYPAQQAMLDFLGYAVSGSSGGSSHRSWSGTMARANDGYAELVPFARGAVSSIFGYSDTYQQILDVVKAQKQAGYPVIDTGSVGVAPFPQLVDTTQSSDTRVVLGRYFFETVSRGSRYQQQAWDLLAFLGGKDQVNFYHATTHKPTSRRDLLSAEMNEPTYGVFAQQVGFASSLPLYDKPKLDDVFAKAVSDALDDPTKLLLVIKQAEMAIGQIIPARGFVGPGPHVITP